LWLKKLLGSKSWKLILGSEAPREAFRGPLFDAERDRERELYEGRPGLVRLEVWREEFDVDFRALDSSRLKAFLNEENRSMSVGLSDF